METVNKNELQNEKCLKQFKLKPKKTALMFLIVAIGLIVFVRRIEAVFFGVVLSIVPILNLFVVKDRVLLEIYDSYFVVYDEDGSGKGQKVLWEEVVEYSFVNEGQNMNIFKISLKNDFFAIPTSNSGLLSEFRKKIPNMESMTKNKLERDARRRERKANRLKKGK